VRAPGRHRLDTRFRDRVETVGADSGGPAAGVPTEQTRAWYKTPAGIAALVGIHVAALAVILAGSDEEPASPF
jgi:hypothetical protein